MIIAPVPSARATDEITIEGTRSPTNNFDFIWTLTNHGDKRVTMLRVDHYYGKTVTPPDGWVRSDMTGNWGEGQKLEPGIIEFKVEKPRKAIGRGQTREFKVNVDRVWRGYREPRTVTVGFEDGTTVEIHGVVCPAKESWFKRNYAFVGLGGIFALFLLISLLKKNRGGTDAATTSEAT